MHNHVPYKPLKPASNFISHFLQVDYQSYAVYRVHQRIPHIGDGLAQTQRKIIHVLMNSPDKKLKTAEIYSMIYSRAKYLHGDASAAKTSGSLSRSATNNINLLTEEGNFGFRTNREAAGPRYTNTRLSKISRILFNKIDENIYDTQEFEGQAIEPKFLLPSVPPVLFNGLEAIAVGYSCDIQPRDPVEVIDACLTILDGGTPSEPHLKFPYFVGGIHHNLSGGKDSWELTGVINRTRRKAVIEITEVPPSYTRETYLKKLDALQKSGEIKKFRESCVKNSFHFEVVICPEWTTLSDDELMDKLKLKVKITENISFINPIDEITDVSVITRFENVVEYLQTFIPIRLKYYQKRKDFILDKLRGEINKLENRIRFIDMVNAGEIQVTRRSLKDIKDDIIRHQFELVDGSFDYLLGMKIWNLTKENSDKYRQLVVDKKAEFELIDGTSVEDMHKEELHKLKEAIN